VVNRQAIRWLTGLAVGWGALLLVLAVLLPVETVASDRAGRQPMRSLTAVHGYRVLALVCVPLVIAVIVAALLRSDAAGATALAWLLSSLLALGAVAGTVTFLIGSYVLPMAIFVVVACARVRPLRPRSVRSGRPARA
jgi:hypothetical protein